MREPVVVAPSRSLPGIERHPHARAVLAAAVDGPCGPRPSHAYLFHGPAGTGKRRIARELATVLLTAGSPDPVGARARVAHGTHPDLTWVVPSGAHEMLVGDIDEPVVAAASQTPFESSWRVFVLERADTLVEAAANKLLKTLEEPPGSVCLILLTDALEEVLPTVASRCQPVRFDPLAPEALAAELEGEGIGAEQARACARLALSDGLVARALARDDGPALRAAAERFARTAIAREEELPSADELLAVGRARGERVQTEMAARALEDADLVTAQDRRRLETEWTERARRARRRAETGALDLALQLMALWFRDLTAVAHGAPELACHSDRAGTLAHDAAGADPACLTRAIALVEETRQRLLVNVTEPLALDALANRLRSVLAA